MLRSKYIKQHINYDNSVQFCGIVDVRSLRHQRSSWARAYTSSCHLEHWVCSQKMHDSAGNTVVFVRFFRYYTLLFFSVVSRGVFFDLFSAVFWQILRHNHAQDARQICLITGCRYISTKSNKVPTSFLHNTENAVIFYFERKRQKYHQRTKKLFCDLFRTLGSVRIFSNHSRNSLTDDEANSLLIGVYQ